MKKWDVVNYYIRVSWDLTKAIRFLESKEFEWMRIEDWVIVIPSWGTDKEENKQMKEMIEEFMWEYINDLNTDNESYVYKVWIKKSCRN